MNRRDLMIAGGCAVALPTVAWAADGPFPSRPVTVVVPFAPGGSTDLVVRPLAVEMERALGAPLVVLNRGGAGGVIGARSVARAKPDGYTWLVGSAGPIIINPLLNSDVGYDPAKDFVPAAVVGTQPLALAVHPKVPAETLAELVKLLKSSADPLLYASSGNGGLPHLTGELLKGLISADLTHVPYQGGGPAVQATVAGNTHLLFDALVSLLPHHKAGSLRILAVCDEQPSALLPEVPSVVQAGMAGLVSTTSNYLLAPAQTPDAIVKQVGAAAVRAMSAPALSSKMQTMGVRFDSGLIGARVSTYMQREIAKWSGVIQRANVKVS